MFREDTNGTVALRNHCTGEVLHDALHLKQAKVLRVHACFRKSEKLILLPFLEKAIGCSKTFCSGSSHSLFGMASGEAFFGEHLLEKARNFIGDCYKDLKRFVESKGEKQVFSKKLGNTSVLNAQGRPGTGQNERHRQGNRDKRDVRVDS